MYTADKLFPMGKPVVSSGFLKEVAYDLKNPALENDKINEELIWSMIQSVSSRDAYMHHLYSKALNSPSRKLKLQLVDELARMMFIDEVFADFMDTTTSRLHFCLNDGPNGCEDKFVPEDFDCLRAMVDTYTEHCGEFNDYARKFIKYLVRECENPTMSLEQAQKKLAGACK